MAKRKKNKERKKERIKADQRCRLSMYSPTAPSAGFTTLLLLKKVFTVFIN